MGRTLHRPLWSRQHGATILLGVSWLIAVASSPRLHPAQPVLLLALLGGFHTVELGLARLRRGELASTRQRQWLLIYAVLAALAGIAAVCLAAPLLARWRWAVAGLLAALLVDRAGSTKQAWGELLLFGALSGAGMLAYRPAAPLETVVSEALPLWLVTWWYFALSIALVKYRLGRLSGRVAAVATLLTAAAIAALRFGPVSTVVPALILLKGSLWLVAARRFRRMPIPTLGLVETAAALIFAVTVVFVVRTRGAF